MAAEAVLKVSEAEERGGELLRQAGEEARDIVKQAEADGERKRKAIIEEALKTRDVAIKAAVDKAGRECAEMAKRGDEEVQKLPSPGKARFDKAVSIIVERIVKIVDS